MNLGLKYQSNTIIVICLCYKLTITLGNILMFFTENDYSC